MVTLGPRIRVHAILSFDTQGFYRQLHSLLASWKPTQEVISREKICLKRSKSVVAYVPQCT